MSIDDRLRAGLAANTEHLRPNLDLKLGQTLRRAHRRQRVRRTSAALVTAAAVAAVGWFVGAGDLNLADRPVDPAQVPHTEPIDMAGMYGRLEPGVYSMPVWGDPEGDPALGDPDRESLPRVVVEVPEGYFTNGGWVVDAGGVAEESEQLGEVAVWKVDRIIPDPCDSSERAPLGSSVRDLARALVRQPGHATTRPRPDTLGGHPGLHLTVTTPDGADLTRCTGGQHALWTTRPNLVYGQHTPGVANDLWILDVDGTRLVVAVSLYPGQPEKLRGELLDIARTLQFGNP